MALCILVTAFLIVHMTFTSTLKAWQRGAELVEELHHGDFVIDQLVLALRSMAFFPNAPSRYGFWLEDHGGAFPRDKLSWVTSSTAFIPPDSPLARGLHRVEVTIDENKDGDPCFAVSAWPHLAKEDDRGEVETWYISSRVKGLECRTYDAKDEEWEDTWEDTNAVPSLIQITVYLDPLEKYGEAVKISRLVEIPIAPAVTSAVSAAESPGTNTTAAATNGTPGVSAPGGNRRTPGSPGGNSGAIPGGRPSGGGGPSVGLGGR